MKSFIANAIVAVLMLSGAAVGDTIYVAQDGSGDYADIQSAVDASTDGDEIIVAAGTYTGTGAQVVDMMGKAIVLRGSGPGLTVIDGQRARRCIVCTSGEGLGTIIESLTCVNGAAISPDVNGGGLYILESSPVLRDCVFRQCVAHYAGGGIRVTDGQPVLERVVFRNNTAPWGGGISTVGSAVSLTQCEFSANVALEQGGGALIWHSQGYLDGCSFSGNTAVAGQVGGLATAAPDVKYWSFVQDTAFCGNGPDHIDANFSDGGGNSFFETCPPPVGEELSGACCADEVCVISAEDDCLYFGGSWLGDGTSCADSPCPSACLGDTDGDGEVNVNDILLVIARFGVTCP